VKGFQATLRGRRLIEHSLKDAPMDAHRALVLAEHNRELDRPPLTVPAGVFREGKKLHCDLQGEGVCSCIVL
jgi:hypothetical protein